MTVVAQLSLICMACLASEGLAAVLPFPFPASVLGMVVLLALLFSRAVKPHQMQQTADFCLGNMPLFFVPACVGIIRYTDVLFRNFWAIVLISLLTTPLVFFVTGHVVQLTMKWMRRKEGAKS